MGENEKKKIQETILGLETNISKTQQMLNEMKENLEYLKDIAWDRNSKKESSSMYKVLNDEKQYTKVKSNVGEVKVDREFMEKEKKHLDNSNLRGAISSKELLSFPKVAKNIEPDLNGLHKDYTWRVKANDDIPLRYGTKNYFGEENLATNYSETDKFGKREKFENEVGVGKQGQPYHLIKDLNFHRPTSGNSTTNSKQSQAQIKEAKIQAMKEKARKASEKNLSKNDERGLEK